MLTTTIIKVSFMPDERKQEQAFCEGINADEWQISQSTVSTCYTKEITIYTPKGQA